MKSLNKVSLSPLPPAQASQSTQSAQLPPSTHLAQASGQKSAPPRRRLGSTFQTSFGSALESLWANRLRSLLTILGVIIGVMAVVTSVTLTQGASSLLNGRFASLGTNALVISPGAATTGGVSSGIGTDQSLTLADVQAIIKVPHVTAVSPILSVSAQLVSHNQNWNTRVMGVFTTYQQIQSWQIAQGSWFSVGDEETGIADAVLGSTVASNLFGASTPIGQIVLIRSQAFRVVGVLQSKGATFGQNQDDIVFVPFSAAFARLKNSNYVDQIQAQVDNSANLDGAQTAITSALRQQHHLTGSAASDFQIRSPTQLAQTAQQFVQVLSYLLIGIAAISLSVGGIGIMNIMLVSVTERTREIGIRMAIGAKQGDIRNQFLVEALTLSAVGGIIGILIGLGIGFLLTSAFSLPFVVDPLSTFVAFAVSAAIGVIFGLYPAVRASRLDPITALRTD